jgi:uncharacterized membrane protein YhaH (DUF805 family)
VPITLPRTSSDPSRWSKVREATSVRLNPAPIPRSTFWCGSLCLGVVFVVLLTVLEQGFGRASSLILYPPVFWAVAALATKRLHDRGKSPFWFLLLLIPLLGPLWLFIDIYFRRGTPGENQYGPDSLDRAGDYLTVN